MHALGFIHEQNRSDRDAYVKIQMDNIIESSAKNFGLFPVSMMTVSGAAPFDFESIMLYPPTMFSKNGQPTMVTVDPKNRIDPRRELSPSDLKRISDVYPR
ncbi:Flavastacin precursor [compost metagenome]